MGNKYVRPQYTSMILHDVLNEAFKEIDALKAWIECQERRITWVEQRDIGPGGSISGTFTEPINVVYTGNNDNIEIRDMDYPILLEKVSKLEVENKKLKKALEFYANPKHLRHHSDGPDTLEAGDHSIGWADNDFEYFPEEDRWKFGKVARAALAEIMDDSNKLKRGVNV